MQQLRAENARLLERLEALEGRPGALFDLEISLPHQCTFTQLSVHSSAALTPCIPCQTDEDLDAFWSALPQASLSGRLLQLPTGVTFLGMPELRYVLYIRDDYVGMLEEVKSSVDSGLTGFVITGSPGIGKSRFGIFVLYQLLVSNTCDTIVWEATQCRRRYLFRRGRKALKGGLDAFVNFLNDKSVWCA